MSPLTFCLIILAISCAFTWIASLITHDTSWVDRLWSVLPVLYVWVFAAYAGLTDLRLDVMAVVVTAWGLRLTFNFARKGGYHGVEDYRWAIVRAGMKPWVFQVFNIVFVVIIQNILLLLIALPAMVAYENQQAPFGVVGWLLAALFVLCLIGEGVADEQQWTFQAWKRRERAAGRDPEPRFVQTGLWRFSRHPNYFFEQAMWWIVFLMGASAGGTLLTWTIAGPILLTALFIGSTRLTEQITGSKYPEYAEYQRRVSAVIPWFPRSRPALSTS